MKISLQHVSGYTIDAYSPGAIRVAGPSGPEAERDLTIHHHSLIISPQELDPDWPPQNLEQLESVHLEQLVRMRPQVVLIGSGQRMHFPRPELLRPLVEHGIGYEIMDTGAACRTYNILAAEGRVVAAALLIE